MYRLDVAPGVDGWISPRRPVSNHHPDWSELRRAVMVKHLAECVRDGVKPTLSAEHARHALEIMVKAIESARSGQAIDLTTTF